MNTTFKDWLDSSPEHERTFAQEQLIVAVAESIWEQMERSHKTKAEIAAALGKSKAFITQLLNGSRNMTLRSLADIASALDTKVNIQLQPKAGVQEWSNVAELRQNLTRVVSEDCVRHGLLPESAAPAEVVRIRYRNAA